MAVSQHDDNGETGRPITIWLLLILSCLVGLALLGLALVSGAALGAGTMVDRWVMPAPHGEHGPQCLRRALLAPDESLSVPARVELAGSVAAGKEDAWSPADDPLDHLPYASPCVTSWDQMEGDELVRTCRQCHKHVYNLTAMSPWEAAEFVRQTEDRLGARLYRRRDGTLLSGNCPVGLRQTRNGIGICKEYRCATDN